MLPIYVISLTDSTERRRAISQQAKSLNLTIQIVDAVDGRKGFSAEQETQIDRAKAREHLRKDLTNGEIACSLSHAHLYQKISQDPESMGAVILEDDVLLSPTFGRIMHSYVLQNSGEMLILLYHSRARVLRFSSRPFIEDITIRTPIRPPCGTAAYFVSPEGAQILMRRSLPIASVADWGFDITEIGAKALEPHVVGHPPEHKTGSILQAQRAPGTKRPLLHKLGDPNYIRYALKKPFSQSIS